ncbi:lumQ [Photobacterium leiognathi lrivu.4.1]|uniref:LumQ n=2 Tax=Photobacterium leiognathi TaxID=553611 RepID=V5F5G2_PHOLE|nr:lumQ [Photobacterium leiognathi lrivu.4.1]
MRMDENQYNVVTISEAMTYHSHEHYKIFVVLVGKCEFVINGVYYCLFPGRGCIINPYVVHGFCSELYNQVLVMNIPKDSIEEDLSYFHSDFFYIDISTQRLITLLVCDIQNNEFDSTIYQSVNNIMLWLLKRCCVTSSPSKSVSKLDIARIENYIQRQIDKKISVAELANLACVSKSQLYSLFKQQIGLTPHQFVLRKRLELAKKLISEQAMPLSQVAHLCGFSSQSSFCQSFRRLYGYPPIRYQKFSLENPRSLI